MEYLKFFVPLILGALGTLIASTFLTSNRLRKELDQESAVLDRLPPGARAELRAEVKRRALLLVSINRHPPFTRVDFLLVVAFLAVAGFGIAFAVSISTTDSPRFTPEYLLTIPVAVAMYGPWRNFYSSWCRRAVARLRYVERHLGAEQAVSTAWMLRLGDRFAGFGAILLFAAATTAMVTAVLHATGVDLPWLIFIGAGLLTSILIATARFGPSENLNYEYALLLDPGELIALYGGDEWYDDALAKRGLSVTDVRAHVARARQ